jgi:hypothetical protein
MTERSIISGAQMNIINKKPGCPGESETKADRTFRSTTASIRQVEKIN